MPRSGEEPDVEGTLHAIEEAIAGQSIRVSQAAASVTGEVGRLQRICEEEVERLRNRCDVEVNRIRTGLAREEDLLMDLRQRQARILTLLEANLTARAQTERPSRVSGSEVSGSAAAYASAYRVPEETREVRHAIADARTSEQLDGAPGKAIGLRQPTRVVGSTTAHDGQIDYDQLVAHVAALQAGPRSAIVLKADPRGRSPKGFASAVRAIAHRTIARAGRPLDRDAILDEIMKAGVPLPDKGTKQKVSKVLSRDSELQNKGRRGYLLVFAALQREMREMMAERERSESAAAPHASIPRATPESTEPS